MNWQTLRFLAWTSILIVNMHVSAQSFPAEQFGWYDVGGYKLYLQCDGPSRAPTVVLLGGLAPSGVFGVVSYDVARFTRVCVFDTAGVGMSDPSPRVTDGRQRAEELHRVLVTAKVTGPLVLVGYEYGAQLARLYADLHPSGVRAVILVNPLPEGLWEKLHVTLANILRSGEMDAWDARRELQRLTERLAAVRDDAAALTANWNVQAGERQLRQARPLKAMPLVVITPGQDVRSYYGERARLPSGSLRLTQILGEQQRTMARLSSAGRQVVSQRAWFSIPEQDPALVVSVIRQVVGALRANVDER
ncbi:alpha/beta fold hydrolase [Deinococcus yavapaiensis]|uniref:Pimeloyl-ACP methyl ester carboxylesterase n=1 Tax=Deinococcus yavapaiensis KR-236 TaxID=694435 RepID=A0A318SC88_9DEIO|nr:alpha/beta hydrolase [Deinococcus yavapaiensis]PYE53930.1 pimeloyl-ACP methyl ester carboxylesterase [Deinococcus yavapaiensis KR-236]